LNKKALEEAPHDHHKNCMLEGAAQTARVTQPVAADVDIQWLVDLANDTGPLPVAQGVDKGVDVAEEMDDALLRRQRDAGV